MHCGRKRHDNSRFVTRTLEQIRTQSNMIIVINHSHVAINVDMKRKVKVYTLVFRFF